MKYIENLNWYMIIEKNTTKTGKFLTSQINHDLVFVGIVVILVLLMISFMIARYNRMLLKTACIDDVTNLPNIKMFQEIFLHNKKRTACNKGTLFMFDVDHFKRVNDQYGHLF